MKIRVFSSLFLTVVFFGSWALSFHAAEKQDVGGQPIATLEGVLMVHRKYMFKYYVAGFGNAQSCALFGEEKLRNIKPGSLIRVEGRLGTRFHDGGTRDNPSPFPRTCYIYMDVQSVRVLQAPDEPSHSPTVSPKGPPRTAAVPDISDLRFVVMDIAHEGEAVGGKQRVVLRLARFYGKIDQKSLDYRLKHETQELKVVTPLDAASTIETNDIIGFRTYEHTKLRPGSRAVARPPGEPNR